MIAIDLAPPLYLETDEWPAILAALDCRAQPR
jgi:hypothetical protein